MAAKARPMELIAFTNLVNRNAPLRQMTPIFTSTEPRSYRMTQFEHCPFRDIVYPGTSFKMKTIFIKQITKKFAFPLTRTPKQEAL